MGIKRCPSCGSSKLLAKKIVGVQVESLDNGEFKINAEGSKYQLEIIGCARCKAEFDESQLVEMTQCKKCGKYVIPTELDVNGECEVCQALTKNPDLANMSKEDVLRMYLRLQKSTLNTMESTQPVTTPVQLQQTVTEEAPVSSVAEEKMKAAQAAISNVSNDFSQEIIKEAVEEQQEVQEMVENMQQEAMNPPVIDENTVEPEKPKRGRPRKKSDTETSETSETGEVTEEQVQQSANEMADFQEAPFPEQDTAMQQMFSSEPVTPQEESQVSYLNATVNNGATTAQGPFQMFENEQSF